MKCRSNVIRCRFVMQQFDYVVVTDEQCDRNDYLLVHCSEDVEAHLKAASYTFDVSNACNLGLDEQGTLYRV